MTFSPSPTKRDSASEEDMLPVSDFSMLMQFIYDTSSFSDRLVQLAFVCSGTKPAATKSVPEQDHRYVTKRADADTAEKGKTNKSTGK
ncbi:hypothetical protein N0V84_011137 [Fusarium piperis]|uniref:Uncharacterized protein n=1 Tax=Fusarium piperis TaxID=1435070 RepID=A0A9W8W3Q2_9HYPO|nr:hypothetical protein N0V84_011137 [Fusarium piperis]